MGDIVTNSGMVAIPEEMRKFISYLNQLIDNMNASMEAALKSLDEIRNTGYSDETFIGFETTFCEEVEFINAINAKLKESADHYGVLVQLVDDHLGTKYSSSCKGQLNI